MYGQQDVKHMGEVLSEGGKAYRDALRTAPALIAEGQTLVLIAQSTIQLNGAELVGTRH